MFVSDFEKIIYQHTKNFFLGKLIDQKNMDFFQLIFNAENKEK